MSNLAFCCTVWLSTERWMKGRTEYESSRSSKERSGEGRRRTRTEEEKEEE